METIEDIVRALRDFDNVAEDGYDQYEAYQMLCWFADRIEKAFQRAITAENLRIIGFHNALISENVRLRDVVDALKACPGIRNCLIKGCASCSHHENGCNSKAVVVALRRFNESEEVSNG